MFYLYSNRVFLWLSNTISIHRECGNHKSSIITDCKQIISFILLCQCTCSSKKNLSDFWGLFHPVTERKLAREQHQPGRQVWVCTVYYNIPYSMLWVPVGNCKLADISEISFKCTWLQKTKSISCVNMSILVSHQMKIDCKVLLYMQTALETNQMHKIRLTKIR